MRDGSRFFIQQRLLSAAALPPGVAAEDVVSGSTSVVQQALTGQPELHTWLREGAEILLKGEISPTLYILCTDP